MKNTKWLSIFILSLAMSFAGCKKSILNDDEGELSNKNVQLRIFPYINDYLYNSDSLYFLGGANLKIDEIQILHSNFYFVNAGDTLPKNDAALWKLSKGDQVLLGYLEPGSYTGVYRYLVGLDTVSNSKSPKDFPAGNPLASQDLYRGSGKGYNFILIQGRIQDPNKPGSEPSIPMSWAVATSGLAIEYGTPKSFNSVPGKLITFDIKLEIDKLFTGLFPIATPVIKCDPADANDFQLAKVLQSNFKVAYKMQI
jgi:hypothetical protein